MIWCNVLLCLGGLLLFGANSEGYNFDVFMRTMKYEVTDKVSLKYFNATMYDLKGRNVIHAIFEFRRNVTSFDVRLWARVPNKAMGYIFDLTFNGCDVIQSNYSGPSIGKVVVGDLRYGKTKLPDRCPFLANEVYLIEQFTLHRENLPPFVPSMNMVANISWSMEKKPTWSIELLFEFIRK